MNDEHIQDDELRPIARQLGTSAAHRLNVDRLAAGVVQRLRVESPAPPAGAGAGGAWWGQPGWRRAAAALVLLVGAGVLVRGWTGGRSSHRSHYVADDLRDLSTDQLREVLGSLDQTLVEPSSIEPSEDDLNDLTTEQLERLLQSLEG